MIEPNIDRQVAEQTTDQFRIAQGISLCSQVLLKPVRDQEQKEKVLDAALEHLRQATGSSRAFLYKNYEDPEEGFCSVLEAIAFDPEQEPVSGNSWYYKIPWSIAPEEAQATLNAGRPYGGVVAGIFNKKPDFLRLLREEGVLSLQFFPIHLRGFWWGYVGFDDRRQERNWSQSEIVLLGTAAEMFANTIQRWLNEAELEQRSRYDAALERCSLVLHKPSVNEEEQVAVLNQALEELREVVCAGRAYLFENFSDPELGLCMRMRAEVCASGVKAHIDNPSNQRMPWSALPLEARQALEEGRSYGGPVEQSFASTPDFVRIFREQKPPLLSVQLVPVQIENKWWGYIGYDDVENSRLWSPDEIGILRIASEIFANTLHRWKTELALRQELEERRLREERLRLLESVVVNTADAVLITDARSIDEPGPSVVYANEAFTTMTGYAAEEIIGQSPRILQGPKTSRRELNRFRKALEAGKEIEIELINYRKDGSEFWVEMTVAPIYNEEGNCTHFIAVQRDVTKRRLAEEALRNARDRLEASVAERTSELLETNRQLRQEIENRVQAENKVKQRLLIEQSLAAISGRLAREMDPWAIFPEIMYELAKILSARRSALVTLEDRDQLVDDIFEWCAPDTRPLQGIVLSNLLKSRPALRHQLEDNQVVVFEGIDLMAPIAGEETQSNLEMDAESLIAVPLLLEEKLSAILFTSKLADDHSDVVHQLDILNVIAGMLGTILRREALLASLEQRAIDRTRELATFYDMTMLAGEVDHLTDILEPALDHIMAVAECQAISIYELSPERTGLQLVAQLGIEQEARIRVDIPVVRGAGWFDDLNEPIIENQLSTSVRLPEGLVQEGFSIYLGAQLRARGKPLGILSCYRRNGQPYSLNTTALVVALAEQLGIIIENYRLRRQAEQGAIIEERQRLARDLHDAITQSLYGVALFARSSSDALEEGDVGKAAGTLKEVEQNALLALKEMRLLLHQLQPLALEQGGLWQAIDTRLNQVERKLGITTRLEISDGLVLRPRAKESVYRIITEALNNSLKHANASEVIVSLGATEGQIQLEISDNGQGIDSKPQLVGMGIRNMKERVDILQGKMQISSGKQGGTRIRVQLPDKWLE